VENCYSENHLLEHRLKECKPFIRAAFENPGEGQNFIPLNTKEIYEMTVDLPIRLNLLFNFSKQTSAVVASNFYESYSTFQIFCNFQFVRLYLSNYDANL